MTEDWQAHVSRIEELARSKGLNYHRVEFEVVPESFMTEIAIYGLPVRMPHWSFGVRYIYQLIQHRMGLSRLFEVVFPGNPGRAYLAKSNSAAENVLVTAHVLGHADLPPRAGGANSTRPNSNAGAFPDLHPAVSPRQTEPYQGGCPSGRCYVSAQEGWRRPCCMTR